MAQPSMGRIAPAMPSPRLPPAILSAEQVAQLLWVIRVADSVELRFSFSGFGRRLASAALDLDPSAAPAHEVTFFDTPDLTLYRRGVVVWIRRTQHNGGKVAVELRPVTPHRLPPGLRRSADFGVKVQAVPGGFVCAASVKASADTDEAEAAMAGRQPLWTLLTNEQYQFLSTNAPFDFQLSSLTMFGPIMLSELGSGLVGLPGPMAAELWNYPDGSHVLVLSAKCDPAEAFVLANETRTYLLARGIDLVADPQAVTRTALELLRSEFAGAAASSPG